MRHLAEAFRAHHAPIVHMVRLYRCNGSNVDLCHRALIEAGQRIVMPGTLGAEIIDDLKPTSGLRLSRSASGWQERKGPRRDLLQAADFRFFHSC